MERKQAIHDVFHSTFQESKPSMRQEKHRTEQIMTELSLLRQLKNNNHIILLQHLNILYDTHDEDASNFNSLQLTYTSSNRRLSEIFESNQYFSDVDIKSILYQIMDTVKYLHSINIIHRNLNPQTILIDEHLFVHISDFYHAVQKNENLKYRSDQNRKSRSYYFDKGSVIESLIKSPEMLRQYLAPTLMREHIKGYKAEYSKPCLDVWSIGMIFTNLLQMKEDIISDYKQRQSFMDRPKDVIIKHLKGVKNVGGEGMFRVLCCHKSEKEIEELIETYKNALDLSKKMLYFRRKQRSRIKSLMKHSYFNDVRKRLDGHIKKDKLKQIDWRWKHHFDWDVVDINNAKKSRRECILEEVLRYNSRDKIKLLKGMEFASAELAIGGFCRLQVPNVHVVDGIKRVIHYYFYSCVE